MYGDLHTSRSASTPTASARLPAASTSRWRGCALLRRRAGQRGRDGAARRRRPSRSRRRRRRARRAGGVRDAGRAGRRVRRRTGIRRTRRGRRAGPPAGAPRPGQVVRTARLAPTEGPALTGDPTGCGDVFGATLFARLLAGDALEPSIHEANRMAAAQRPPPRRRPACNTTCAGALARPVARDRASWRSRRSSTSAPSSSSPRGWRRPARNPACCRRARDRMGVAFRLGEPAVRRPDARSSGTGPGPSSPCPPIATSRTTGRGRASSADAEELFEIHGNVPKLRQPPESDGAPRGHAGARGRRRPQGRGPHPGSLPRPSSPPTWGSRRRRRWDSVWRFRRHVKILWSMPAPAGGSWCRRTPGGGASGAAWW